MDWSNLGEVSDWNDLSKMMEGGGGEEQKPAKPADKKESGNKGGSSSNKQRDQENQRGRDDTSIGGGRRSVAPATPLDDEKVGDWTDMKQFDDDHDPDWFEEEEKKLAKVYGGHFIKVKYTEQGRPGYFCELCLAEMNAKKSLEAHCEGMKHLKKKALWEKNSSGDQEESRALDGRKGGWNDNAGRDRSPLRRGRDSPPHHRGGGRFGGGDRRPRSPPRRGEEDDFRRKRDERPDDRFERPGGFGSGRSSNERLGGRNDEGFDRRRDEGMGRRPDEGMGRRPDEGMGRRPDEGMGGRVGPYPDNRFGGRLDDRFAPAPVAAGANGGGVAQSWDVRNESHAAPVVVAPKDKLCGGTTGILLTKLASCYIKDEEDAELALSVVSSLASSLREYNTKKGEKKIAELLMEAELKLNTLKALKVGLKLLNNKQMPAFPPAPSMHAAPATAPAAPPLARMQQQHQAQYMPQQYQQQQQHYAPYGGPAPPPPPAGAGHMMYGQR